MRWNDNTRRIRKKKREGGRGGNEREGVNPALLTALTQYFRHSFNKKENKIDTNVIPWWVQISNEWSIIKPNTAQLLQPAHNFRSLRLLALPSSPSLRPISCSIHLRRLSRKCWRSSSDNRHPRQLERSENKTTTNLWRQPEEGFAWLFLPFCYSTSKGGRDIRRHCRLVISFWVARCYRMVCVWPSWASSRQTTPNTNRRGVFLIFHTELFLPLPFSFPPTREPQRA